MLKRYDNTNPVMLNSAVCFVDILGFSQLIKDSFQQGTGNDLLKRLHKSLNEKIAELRPREDYVGVLKSFTDNIIIGKPIHEDGESQLGGIFLDFAAYQLSLTLEGFFVRGGVSIGEYYGDEEFAFGPALLKAYELESIHAKNPRIILSNEVVSLVNLHIGYYAEPMWAPQVRDLLKDNTDGKWFINYLEATMGDREPNDYVEAHSILQRHKEIIEHNLAKHKGNPKIYPKYEWAAQYHNYFCDLNSNAIVQYPKIAGIPNGNFSLIV
ncbi:hypothetical protein [Aneurinibacillus sp. UBA3580]|jgi:hypothetical protein|uniref:hypothetical protein n=1 Tax=Aneurinibacillus sp. UBA3580 TaxID=1946041 RepID=UPI00257B89CE|nr:hypothetical protein [Aneurinibacillus sp. UBA3580]